MSAEASVASPTSSEEILSLIETLHATERRLEDLTAGEIDTVAGSDGRTFLLHRAQQQLRHGDVVKQAALLDALPAHVAVLDSQGQITSVNEAWRQFARDNAPDGCQPGPGLNYLDICDRARGDGAADARLAAQGIRAVLDGGARRFVLEYRCDSPTDQRWFVLTVAPLAAGPAGGATALHLDITALRRSEEALQQLSETTARRERMLSTTLASMSDLAQVYDRDGRFLFANQSLLDLWGLTLDQVVGKDFRQLGYPAELAEKLQRQLQTVFETRQSLTSETAYTSPSGHEGYYEYIFSPVLAADGSADFVVGSGRNVTERRRAERVLRQSEEHFRFLDALGEATRAAIDPEPIMAVVSRMLGEHLRVSRCAYADVEADGELFTIRHDYTDGCPSTVGSYQLSLFGARAVATLRAAETLIIRDTEAELLPGEGADTFASLSIRAIVCCPLVKNGALRAMMAVHQSSPRDWTPAEVAIVQDVAERSWATIERRKTEERLRDSEALLAIASRASRLGGWAVDLPEIRMNWSDEACAIHDLPPGAVPTVEEALGFYAPGAREAISAAFGACTREGTPYDLELEIITAKGRHVWVRTIGEARRNAAGAITRVQGALQDITERRSVADALRTSMEEFRSLTDAMPQIVWISRPDGSNVYVNQQWLDYTGLTREESLGPGWSAPFHPEDRDRALDAWQHATGMDRPYSLECRLLGADGVYRWRLVRSVPLREADGTVLKWFGTATDIHDLKLAQLQISASEERFGKVFHSKVVAIGISELASGRLIDVNERWADFFGYSRDEVLGRTVSELGLWADPADRVRLIAGITAGSLTSRLEAAFRRKSGEIRSAMASMEAITLAGVAEPLGIMILVDMTEHKLLESQLRQSQKMEAVGRLAGGVAHDFNNSLGVIQGYAELLTPTASDAQRGRLEQILKATRRATALTRQLLAFSRKQIVNPKVLDLNACLSDLQEMLQRLIGEHIDFTILPGENLGRVKADLGQLEQVVVNLCVNARDAMGDGGWLRIATANSEFDTGAAVPHAPMTPGRYVVMTVSDNGCGIERDVLPQIFEPFFTTKEEGKGTGLGLAMAYGIVKQAGGYIWVDSESGLGTTFTIYLPRVDGSVEEDLRTTPTPARGWETILLVEDEGSLRALAREILEEHGYVVIEAAGGHEALEIAGARPEPIHLLLTDVVMPRMNGRALAESLVAARPQMKVLYMSGYTSDVIAQSGVLDAGVLLIEKPFSGLALQGRVREILDGGPRGTVGAT